MAATKFTITNFQSHLDTVIELHPGFNVITGDTDSGKSAIMRGFGFCAYNKSKGDTFRSWWGGETLFRIDLDTNEYVSRIKGKENLYDANGKVLKSFKTKVPDEVQQILNLSDVNLQKQLDSHFLITGSTDGQIAQYFNKIAHLDKIDTANKNIKSEIYKTKQNIKFNETELESTNKELIKYAYIDEAEKVLKEIEKLEKEKHDKITEALSLNNLISKIEITEEKISKINVEECDSLLDELTELYNQKVEAENEINELSDLVESISDSEDELAEIEILVSIEDDLNEVLNLVEERNSSYQKLTELSELIESISETEKELKTNKKDIIKLDKQWHENMPDVCPLCEK